ncbi:ABC transporter permease [Solibacillus sp. CAU 1738]|uniref:ABC transporter permease n=1 Tax=Solibacillus sp. CAU 1738 TaxID=3140363 RepID=UPI0032618ED9
MLQTIFKSMIVMSLRDKITLFYSLLFPMLLMIGLGYYFHNNQLQIVCGITAISTIFWGMQGIAFQIHAQRNKGVYKLLKLTPLPLVAFIIIMVLARTLIGVLLNMLIWITGIMLFHIEITTVSLIYTCLFIIIGTLCFTSIGFVIGNFARNEAQISVYSNMIQIPMIFMSEAFYSLERAPEWVAVIGKLLPFEHYVRALRGVIIDGHSFLASFIVLIVYLLIAICISVSTFKWDDAPTQKPRKREKLAS